jgi:hypothetical protein
MLVDLSECVDVVEAKAAELLLEGGGGIRNSL